MKRYNLGSGGKHILGWINVDIDGSADIQHDLSNFPWPFPDSEADEILASHIIEHLFKKDAWRFLSECWRIMKIGAVIHIAVPDMDKFINCKLTGDWAPIQGYFWRDLNHLLGGDERERNEHQRHKYMYNYETLAYMLKQIGFLPSRRDKPIEFDTPDYAAFSLYVDAVRIA